MALQKNITWNGLNIPTAYYKVAKIEGDKTSIKAFVNMSASQSDPVLSQDSYIVSIDLNGSNFIAQVYEHLKTLPEFSGAENV